jgi:hypothetical protein
MCSNLFGKLAKNLLYLTRPVRTYRKYGMKHLLPRGVNHDQSTEGHD